MSGYERRYIITALGTKTKQKQKKTKKTKQSFLFFSALGEGGKYPFHLSYLTKKNMAKQQDLMKMKK